MGELKQPCIVTFVSVTFAFSTAFFQPSAFFLLKIEIMTHELEVSFSTKKLTFTQVKKTEKGYIYHVHSGGTNVPYFHVFKRKTTPLCIDFEKRLYSETERKETYPKDECFGSWAWIYFSLDKAIDHLNKF